MNRLLILTTFAVVCSLMISSVQCISKNCKECDSSTCVGCRCSSYRDDCGCCYCYKCPFESCTEDDRCTPGIDCKHSKNSGQCLEN